MSIKKYNRYDLTGEFGIGYTYKNEPFYFDLEDYNKIKYYCWRTDKDGYLVARGDNEGLILRMHQLIFGEKNPDHINRNPADNRKCNLRKSTISQNNRNKSLQYKNYSGCSGVRFDKSRNKWRAEITFNKKLIYLGRYDKLEDAINARKEAERKYYQEFAPT